MVEQAVILAERTTPAGSGSAADPCRTLLGLGLLQRMVLALAHGGIRRILVVACGHGCLDVLAEAGPEWRRTGAEVRLAAPGATDLPLSGAPFLLLDGMVVFGAELAQRLRSCQVDGDCILAAGESEPAPARFTGMALCPATSFPRLMAAAAEAPGGGSLDAGLASARPMTMEGGRWVAVDSRAALRRARRLLRRSLGKPSDGFFSRHLNRRLSWPISRVLLLLRVRPNAITLANLALGLVSAWLAGRGGFRNTAAASLLFQFVSVTDGCDGEVARLTFRFSAFGAWLDNLCDTIVLVAFFLSLPLGLSASRGNPVYLWLGGVQMLLLASFYLMLLAHVRLSGHRGNIAEIAHEIQNKGKAGKKLNWIERMGTRLGFIYRKEFISLYAMVWCVAGRPEVFLASAVGVTSFGFVYYLDSARQLRSRRRPPPG
jgi:phosphatidylglycerophosphate synthase